MSLKVKRNLMLLAFVGVGISGLAWSILTANTAPADSALLFWACLVALLSVILGLASFISLCVRIWNDKE